MGDMLQAACSCGFVSEVRKSPYSVIGDTA